MSETTIETVETDPRVEELQAQVEDRDRTIAALQRRQEIDRLLREANAIDADTARVLIDSSLNGSSGDDDVDLAELVADLKSRKPFLFESARRRNASTQSPRPAPSPPDHVEHAAAEAFATGKRSDLLRYLRLRRKSA